MKKPFLLSVLLSLLLGPFSLAAGSSQESDFIPQFLDRDEVLAAAKTVTSEAYPDAEIGRAHV